MKRIAPLLVVMLLLRGPAMAADLLLPRRPTSPPAMQESFRSSKRPPAFKAEATYTSTGKLYGQDRQRRALRHAAGRRRENPGQAPGRGPRRGAFRLRHGPRGAVDPQEGTVRHALARGREGLRQGRHRQRGDRALRHLVHEGHAGPWVSGTRCSPPGLRPEHQPALPFRLHGRCGRGLLRPVVHPSPRGGKGCFPRGARGAQGRPGSRLHPQERARTPMPPASSSSSCNTPEVAAIKAKYGYE
jgi:molybdate transport system substrate-binding protein